MAEGGGGGYDIGASISPAASSGAAPQNALAVEGGGIYGSTAYGPGSVVLTSVDQTGSVGASATAGLNLGTIVLTALIGAAALWLFRKLF